MAIENELVKKYSSADPRFDPPSLKGLEEGDWSAVTHAHGEATDVPALIRALVSPDSVDRRHACQDLFETIWHQGTVYDATVEAIPFLYNLLEEDGVHDKASVALLLAVIADGQPALSGCIEDPGQKELWDRILKEQGHSLEVELAHERDFHEELMRRIADRLHLLFSYLRHPEPDLRRSVVAAIGRFRDAAERASPLLEELLHSETDEHVREAFVATLGCRMGSRP